MSRNRLLVVLVLASALTALAGLPPGPLTPAARAQAGQAQRLEQIRRAGKLPGWAYRTFVAAKYGTPRRTPANVIARAASPGSSVVQVGDEPPGFGKVFQWDRKDDKILLALFINAADDLGVSVAGLERGDVVQVSSASGIASFSEDKGNPTASSIVGLIATGAKAAAGLSGNGEFVPLLNAAEAYAKDRFKATNAKTKRRDAFGVDPGSGHKARQEGGIIVCLPEAGGTLYSGESESRWIKPDGTRTDNHLPAHFPPGAAFFPMQGVPTYNTRTVYTNGELYVLPWDWKHDDNAGYYKVFVKLTKGTGPVDPGPILRKKGSTAKPKPKPKP